jgi:septum site-determining protein MinC
MKESKRLSEQSTPTPRIRATRLRVMTLEWPAGVDTLDAWLDAQCSQAPALMAEIAVVLKPPVGIDAAAIQHAVALLRGANIGLMGLTGDATHRSVAESLGIPWVSGHSVIESGDPTPSDAGPAQAPSIAQAMVVDGPIRSGVQIYAKEQDLVVWGQVSAGAEIMADGHVHVYGRLLGRVAAGVSGAQSAQIFCQHFEPSLVSVAGIYASSEQVPETLWSATVRVGLDASGQSLTYQTHE